MKKTLAILSSLVLLAGLYAASQYNYLLFHSFAEVFSVVIACGIFMVAWNTRQFANRHYLLFLGIAYLFVGILDFLHTLSYSGMNVFPGFGPNAPTQLWIAARYMEALTLLAAPMMLRRRVHPGYYFLFYATASTLVVLSVFVWRIFPDCFIPGAGLTPFKIISEYVICGILVASGAFLLQRRDHFEKGFLAWTLSSIAVTILSELAFTTYASVYGFANLLGHFLKIVSFYLIYKAVIATGLSRPYDVLFRDLRMEHERFRVTLTSIGDAVIATDPGGIVTFLNPVAEELTGWKSEEAAGRNIADVFRIVDERTGEPLDGPVGRVLLERRTIPLANHAALVTKDGRSVPIEDSAAPILDAGGILIGCVLVFHDVTQKRRAEEALLASLGEKEILLKEIHHRVKNNMQVISSLMDLQSGAVEDPGVRDVFRDMVGRVRSMALVHEKLYQSRDLARVDFAGYADVLLKYMWKAQGAVSSGVRLNLDLKPTLLSVNEAVPCGLILNELFSNSLKHAFRGRDGGNIHVSLCEEGEGDVSLSVRDDGVGLPPQVDWEQAGSMGLRIVKVLARQLRAEIAVQSSEGAHFTLRFRK